MAATLKVIIDVDDKGRVKIRGVGDDVDKLSLKASSLGKAMHAAAAGFSNFAKIAGGAAVAGVAAFGASVGASVKQFATFEDKMLHVKGVMGASAEEYKTLTALTRELGMTTRYTATEAAEGLVFLAMAGLKVEEAIGALPQVLKLAQASVTDVGTTADIVTNIMAGYGIQVKDLAKTSDILTATFTNSNTNLTELGYAFKYVGPIAKSLEMDLEETAAALGILAQAGYKGEMGGTALRNILLALIAPMGDTARIAKKLGVDFDEMGIDVSSSQNALKSLGVEVKDANGDLRSMPAILVDLVKGLENFGGSADKTGLLAQIFGKRGGPQLAGLLNIGSDSIVGLEKKIHSLGGVTDKIAAEMESGMGGALRNLWSAIESVSISYGNVFVPAVKVATESVTAFARELSKGIESGQFDQVSRDAVEMAKTVSGAFGEIIRRAKEMAPAVKAAASLIGSSFYEIGDNAAAAASKIVDFYNQAESGAKKAAGASKGAYEGFRDWIDDNVISPIARTAKELFGVEEPARKAAGGIKSVGAEAEKLSTIEPPGHLILPLELLGNEAEKTGGKIKTLRAAPDASWMLLEEWDAATFKARELSKEIVYLDKNATKGVQIAIAGDVDGTKQPLAKAMANARGDIKAFRDAASDKKVTISWVNPDGRPTSEVLMDIRSSWESLRASIKEPLVAKLDTDPMIQNARQALQLTQSWLSESQNHYDKFWTDYFGKMEMAQFNNLTMMTARAKNEIDHAVAMQRRSLNDSLSRYNDWLASEDPRAADLRKKGYKPLEFSKGTGEQGLPGDGLFYGHQGEIVLNPQESREYRQSNTNNNNITINVSGAGSPEMTAAAIKRQLDNLSVRWGTA